MGRLWRSWGGWGKSLVVWAEGGKYGRQEGEPVEHPVQHRQPKHLEEGDEDVGGGEGEDDDGEQGGDARVHNCRAKSDQGVLRSLSSRAWKDPWIFIFYSKLLLRRAIKIAKKTKNNQTLTLCHGEGVGNVDGVVDAEAASEDDIDADDHIDGHVPEVKCSNLQGWYMWKVLRYGQLDHNFYRGNLMNR